MSDYLVDERHAEEIGKLKWSIHPDGYFQTNIRVDGRWSAAKMHRIVWSLEYGRLPLGNLSIDHINGIKTDNRIANLRPASGKLQSLNRTQKRKTDLPRGVVRSGGLARPYRARLQTNGPHVDGLGTYATPEEASAVYEAALAAAIEAEAKKCWEMFWNQEEKTNVGAA